MFSLLKKSLFGIGASLLLAGCQTGGTATPASHTMTPGAVQCDKCQTTWVNTPGTTIQGGQGGSGITGYSTQATMACPDCKSAAVNFFTTGNLMHDCKACAGNMKACEAH